jgi:hypothetical protein
MDTINIEYDEKLSAKGYVATAKDIEALVHQRIAAGGFVLASRATYLRALIATAQHNLGINPKRVMKHDKADQVTISQHVAALDAVHATFYEAVQKAAAAAPLDPDDDRDGDVVLASRIVFARSAYSTVRGWLIRGGHSLLEVVAAKATKHGLAEETPARKAGARPFNPAPFVKAGDTLLGKLQAVSKKDRENAAKALHDIIAHLTAGLAELEGKRKPATS